MSFLPRKSWFQLALVLAVAVVAYLVLWHNAVEFQELERSRGGLGYVSDETWYVAAARIILVKVLGMEPKQLEDYGVTIVFKAKPSYSELESLAMQVGVNVSTYSELPAIYAKGLRERVLKFIEKASARYSVDAVIPGWRMPDKKDIHNYLNLEHPPLGKYLIAISMVLLGDVPAYWRVPVVISGIATIVLTYLVLVKLTGKALPALAGSLLLLADPLARAMFSISMLDGFAALFTMLALYLAVEKRCVAALVTSVIGGLFKATGLFAALPVIFLLARRESRLRSGSLRVFLASTAYYGSVAALLYLSLLTLVSMPLIAHVGAYTWYTSSIAGAIKWHLSIKCTGSGCPQSSAPWDWILGTNSFPLYIYPEGRVLYASGATPLWIASTLLLVLGFPAVYKGVKRYGYVLVFYLGVLGGYLVVWILGGKTQYSFYAIQLAPLVYANATYVVSTILASKNYLSATIEEWQRVLLVLVSPLARCLEKMARILVALLDLK